MTKDDLREFCWLRAEVQQVKAMINVVRVQATSAGTMNLSGMPPTGGVPDPVATAGARLDTLQRKYADLLAELANRQGEIEDAIAALDGIERMVMRYRYIEGLTWPRVADATFYSEKQARRIHDRAVKKLGA